MASLGRLPWRQLPLPKVWESHALIRKWARLFAVADVPSEGPSLAAALPEAADMAVQIALGHTAEAVVPIVLADLQSAQWAQQAVA